MPLTTGDGLQHSVTLNSLDSNMTNCLAPHNITVTCKNTAAAASATGATGTGQTNFTVDLSKVAEYAPTVTSGMESGKAITIADPVLKAETKNRPAECEYNEGAKFIFGSGKKFDTTGTYSHNTQLNSLNDHEGKSYDYYVICKDRDTCALSADDFKISFKVALEDDPNNIPTIESTTPPLQPANPALSITTNIPSTCQYKLDSTFVYGDKTATQFTNESDNGHSHTASLASLPDKSYNFYVACKSAAGVVKTYDKVITTVINRSGLVGPVISNTTNPNQPSTPTLSITTLAAATCKYKKDTTFSYEDTAATLFTTDGGTGHSVLLPTMPDGKQTFYVACKDKETGIANVSALEIIFTVASGSTTCIKLSSNDKQNDDERVAQYNDNKDNNDNADSNYLWRSVENGVRKLDNACSNTSDCQMGGECVKGICKGSYTAVNRYTGYQFTPSEDGQVDQLCGYFAAGESNKVILYNSGFNVLATATVKGTDDWKCVNISATPVKTDRHYYVIAKIDGNSLYYEYNLSGLLPREANNAQVEAGIRQEKTNDDFGTDIVKYDQAVFGLVDVRIRFASENSEGPEISSAVPVGPVHHDYAVLSVETDANATCKFGRDDVEYADMDYSFGTTGAKIHEQKVCDLEDGNFTWYVRCKNTEGGKMNDASTMIQFETSN